jgi:hypothetical protein
MKRISATLCLCVIGLSACNNDDKARLAALQAQVAMQDKRLAEQQSEIARLQRELATATANSATKVTVAPSGAAQAPDEEANETKWKLAITQLNHNSRSHSFHARVTVTNVTDKRLKGSLCVQLIDRGGAQVEHFVASERAVPAGGTQVVEVEAPLSLEQWTEAVRLRAYVAPFGCTDEAPGDALVVDRAGRPVPAQ